MGGDWVTGIVCFQFITKDEFNVTITQSAEGGRRRANAENYSLILLDIAMPGMKRFMMPDKVQGAIITQSIPIILITSLSDIENEQLGLILGAVDYITKPFNPSLVKAKVRTYVKLYNYWRQIEHQSVTDPLTGIANRWQYEHCSVLKWEEAVRRQIHFSVCMFDIDYFKSFNDTFGHPAGDQVIISVAKTVSFYLQRSTDFLARYGGEEFVAFLLGDSQKEAYQRLETIREAVEALQIPHDPSVAEWVTVSVGGVTLIPHQETSYHFCLEIADKMLYDAKKCGRNKVVWADGQEFSLCQT